MNSERVCGTCVFGADAYDRYGNLDSQYVICQVKEAENRQRKPDRFQTTSAVSRMHYWREACLHWRSDPAQVGESPLPMHQQAYQAGYQTDYGVSDTSSTADPLYDSLYGGPRVEAVEIDAHVWHAQAAQQAQSGPSSYTSGGRSSALASAESEAEIKSLKTRLIQSEQMVVSLQNQNMYLAEEISRLKEENEKHTQKLDQLKPFDLALFAEVNYFSLLGIKESATPEQIKDAYRARVKIFHPDRFVNISQRLNLAYETLMDSEKRRKYLQQINQPFKGKSNA